MSRLFSRRCTLEIAGATTTPFLIEGLRTTFQITKDTSGQPNQATITVYNLAETTRGKLRKDGTVNMRLLVGYASEPLQRLFSGTITRIFSQRDEADWITTFQLGDGAEAYSNDVETEIVSDQAAFTLILRNLSAAGLPEGNLKEILLTTPALNKVYTKAEIGPKPLDNVRRLADEAGLTFTVDSGEPVFVSKNEIVRPADVPYLSAFTGLIGSPEYTNKGNVKARVLIQRNLKPSGGVQLVSRYLDSVFRIERVVFSGDTHAQDWYADLELVTLDGKPPAQKLVRGKHKRAS